MHKGLATLYLATCIGVSVGVHSQEPGDPIKGRRLFAQCTSCHTAEADGADKLGPNLHGVLDRKAGSLPNYTYSDAMRGADIVWNAATLDRYLKLPSAMVRGNKMAFAGVPKDQDRADIIAYLRQVGR